MVPVLRERADKKRRILVFSFFGSQLSQFLLFFRLCLFCFVFLGAFEFYYNLELDIFLASFTFLFRCFCWGCAGVSDAYACYSCFLFTLLRDYGTTGYGIWDMGYANDIDDVMDFLYTQAS
ncbi:hypothetical protein DFH27DRAFT_213234 [Peziza echinospora]|nr:hypothetical protein DFH27DRAFT_213234 [Peziza echinospora]